jgi:hypothetical protein
MLAVEAAKLGLSRLGVIHSKILCRFGALGIERLSVQFARHLGGFVPNRIDSDGRCEQCTQLATE